MPGGHVSAPGNSAIDPVFSPTVSALANKVKSCCFEQQAYVRATLELRWRGDRTPLWTDPLSRFRVHLLFQPCCLPVSSHFIQQHILVSNMVSTGLGV